MRQWAPYRGTVGLVVFSSMLAALCIALWISEGHSVTWAVPQSFEKLEVAVPASVPAAVVPLSTLAATWQQSLFSPLRQADSVSAPPEPVLSSLDGFAVTGIVVTPTLQVVFMKQVGGPALKVKQGDQLPNGWLVERVDSRQVQFSHGARHETLWLVGRKPKS